MDIDYEDLVRREKGNRIRYIQQQCLEFEGNVETLFKMQHGLKHELRDKKTVLRTKQGELN